ncbi:MAG: hypothetical protein ACFCVD_15455 [Nodosilinea sp.]
MILATIQRRIKQAICLSCLSLLICSGLILGWGQNALAGSAAASIEKSRAEQELDRVAGQGTANQIEGRAKAGIGRVQRQVDQATSQFDGTGKQIQGRAQENIGRTQAAAEDVTDAAQDSAEGVVDAIKDFFRQ